MGQRRADRSRGPLPPAGGSAVRPQTVPRRPCADRLRRAFRDGDQGGGAPRRSFRAAGRDDRRDAADHRARARCGVLPSPRGGDPLFLSDPAADQARGSAGRSGAACRGVGATSRPSPPGSIRSTSAGPPRAHARPAAKPRRSTARRKRSGAPSSTIAISASPTSSSGGCARQTRLPVWKGGHAAGATRARASWRGAGGRRLASSRPGRA